MHSPTVENSPGVAQEGQSSGNTSTHEESGVGCPTSVVGVAAVVALQDSWQDRRQFFCGKQTEHDTRGRMNTEPGTMNHEEVKG